MKYVYDQLGRWFSRSGDAYQYDAVGNLLSIKTISASQFSVVLTSSGSGQADSNVTLYGTDFCSTPTVTLDGAPVTGRVRDRKRNRHDSAG